MRACEFISEATNQHKIPDFSVPIIPDYAPFGAKQFKDPTGTFKGSGMSTPPPANTKAPPVQNVVVPPPTKAGLLTGRVPTKPEDVTHAYRNMSPAELLHAQNNGAFLPNPNTKVAKTWDTNHKYWSSGDEQGHFGRDWKNSSDAAKVRVPIGKVSSDTAVNAGHAEVFNRETGQWMPVVSGLPKK